MDELKSKRIFKTNSRAKSANKRFEDIITGYDVYQCLEKYDYKCFYCSEDIRTNKWQLDHFYPRANGGLNVPSNLVPCCRWCNTMKNALDGNAFIDKCKKIVCLNYFKVMEVPEIVNDHIGSGIHKKRVGKVVKYISKISDDNLTDQIKDILKICTTIKNR